MNRFAHRAVSYCASLDRETFDADQLVQDAVLRNIELIGEAATRIPEAIRLAHPEIPWREIIAMRNQLIHAYLGVDLDVVWDVIQVELPLLILQLKTVLS
ncbi:MAG: HepT-like ribonuclease domain-containing protein [Prochlorococcaceae cyanobacterium]